MPSVQFEWELLEAGAECQLVTYAQQPAWHPALS